MKMSEEIRIIEALNAEEWKKAIQTLKAHAARARDSATRAKHLRKTNPYTAKVIEKKYPGVKWDEGYWLLMATTYESAAMILEDEMWEDE